MEASITTCGCRKPVSSGDVVAAAADAAADAAPLLLLTTELRRMKRRDLSYYSRVLDRVIVNDFASPVTNYHQRGTVVERYHLVLGGSEDGTDKTDDDVLLWMFSHPSLCCSACTVVSPWYHACESSDVK